MKYKYFEEVVVEDPKSFYDGCRGRVVSHMHYKGYEFGLYTVRICKTEILGPEHILREKEIQIYENCLQRPRSNKKLPHQEIV